MWQSADFVRQLRSSPHFDVPAAEPFFFKAALQSIGRKVCHFIGQSVCNHERSRRTLTFQPKLFGAQGKCHG